MTTNSFLGRLVSLGGIDDVEQAAITAACGPVEVVEPNQHLVSVGDEPRCSIALLTGLACRVNDLSDGRRQILSFQVPGDGVDLYGYALRRLDHTVVTLTRCEISRIPFELLDDLVARFPHLALTLWRETILDASIMREQLVRVGQRPALERAANLFCEIAHRFDAVGLGRDGVYDLPVTQPILASALGLSAVHVNRVTRQLHQRGIATLSRKCLTILDRPALEQLGDFDPAYLETVKLHRSPR
ncbi:Crp/Fnr family transcriptional regulator [soil metagenome]